MPTICPEQTSNLLDQETTVCNATYCQIGQSHGVVESVYSIAHFLRSETTTLDRLGLLRYLPTNVAKSPQASLNVLQQKMKETRLLTQHSIQKPILGCESA